MLQMSSSVNDSLSSAVVVLVLFKDAGHGAPGLGPRQRDQRCTVLFLSLPAGKAPVPAGFLPTAIILPSFLSVPHVRCVKMQTKRTSPD